jgi:hypothetical protein
MNRNSSGFAATTAYQIGCGRSCWAQEPKAMRRSGGAGSSARTQGGRNVNAARSSGVQRWESTKALRCEWWLPGGIVPENSPQGHSEHEEEMMAKPLRRGAVHDVLALAVLRALGALVVNS